MTEPLYYVIIRAIPKRTGRRRKRMIVRKMGPYDYAEANAVSEGAAINLDHENFTIQVKQDRKAYFAAYHKRRYRDDPAYRERLMTTARDWHRKARASARGDMTPWLTQD